MAKKTLIIDYGLGNIYSIHNALKQVAGSDQDILISQVPADLDHADRLILPGVGAFPEGITRLKRMELFESIQQNVGKGKPLLGICLGMQMLADKGYEHLETAGLGLVRGVVDQLKPDAVDHGPKSEERQRKKIPHIGWAKVVYEKAHPVLEKIESLSCFYFVHSFVFRPSQAEHCLGLSEYGERFAAMIQNANIVGCQFHPEKSGAVGLQLLNNFCRWDP